jgi:hypothetical protein
MTGPGDRERLDRRMEEASRLLREHRLLVDPDPHFADRVLARLSRDDGWMFAWAARRVLPVTLTVAAMLMVAVLAVDRATPQPLPAASASSTIQQGNDPLEWLLEDGRGVR